MSLYIPGGDRLTGHLVTDPRGVIEGFTGASVEELMRVGYAVASRKLATKEDRQDAVQEAFVRVVDASRRREIIAGSATAYFATTVKRVIVDMWKARLAEKRGAGAVTVSLEQTIAVQDPQPTPHGTAENAALRRLILSAIDTLSASNRAVLDLAIDIDSGDFNRMSHAEIGARLGIDPKVVKSRLHEAKRKLALCLADWREEEH